MKQGVEPTRRWVVSLLMANVGLIALSFVPAVEGAAVYLRLATLVVTLVALVLAVRYPSKAGSVRRVPE